MYKEFKDSDIKHKLLYVEVSIDLATGAYQISQ
jgi:hypothetical protein